MCVVFGLWRYLPDRDPGQDECYSQGSKVEGLDEASLVVGYAVVYVSTQVLPEERGTDDGQFVPTHR